MKTLAISTNGKDLDANVEPRFGRALFFILVDPTTEEWETVDNPANIQALHGVGSLTAKNLIKGRVVETVVTGHCGPQAFEELTGAGVQVFFNARGTVRQALTGWRRGELTRASTPPARTFRG